MKKYSLLATTVVCMIGLGWALGNAWGQGQGTTAKAAPDTTPHKIGLIDMAFLFSKYGKFEELRKDLKVEIDGADAQLKAELQKIQALQAEMKELTPTSKEYIDKEKRITEMAAAAEGQRKNMQRRFVREETKIYQQCYKETQDAVNKYAGLFHYTLIIRFSRDEAAEGDDPQKVMQSLQRQVVFNRPQDDITDKVLIYLNKQYKPAKGIAGKEEGGSSKR